MDQAKPTKTTKSAAKPTAKSAARPTAKTAAKPAAKSAARPASKSAAKTARSAKPRRTASTRQAIPGQVLKRLREYIIEHDLKPGDRLPTERQLAEDLAVSRNSVREALTSLESVGAVSRRPKVGCVLQPVDLATLAEVTQFQMLRDASDLSELYTARCLLEESILPLAVANATDQDLLDLEQNTREMEKAITDGVPVYDLDEAFHRSLFTAAHNKFLFQFGSLIQVFFRESRRRIRASAKLPNLTIQEHRDIVQAIRDRDIAAAQKHMRLHLSTYVRTGTIEMKDAAK